MSDRVEIEPETEPPGCSNPNQAVIPGYATVNDFTKVSYNGDYNLSYKFCGNNHF